MILGASAYMQVLQALACFAVGLVCAFLWLFVDKVPLIKLLRFVSDTVLVVLAAVAMLCLLQLMNKGELLFFHPLSLLFGFFASWTTVPKIFPKLKPSIEPKLFKSKGKVKKFFIKVATALNNATLKLSNKTKSAFKNTTLRLKDKAKLLIDKLPNIKRENSPKKSDAKNQRLLYENSEPQATVSKTTKKFATHSLLNSFKNIWKSKITSHIKKMPTQT